jgi:hypothetical protein
MVTELHKVRLLYKSGYVIPCVGNLTEEKVQWISIGICRKYNLVIF